MIRTLIIIAFLLPFYSDAQTAGCTDPAATNYDPGVTINNGSCLYPPLTLTSPLKTTLASTFVENSGMVFWNDKLWMHNDGGGAAAIYDVDTTNGNVLRTVAISNASNSDWEDMAQDENFIYIGDFGNNNTGNRTDLKIYRVSKSDVLAGNSVLADVISFSYPEQTIGPSGSNNTDYDCEAMVVNNGKIYLFTKQWVSQGTALYELPVLPGTYSATLLGTQNVGGLITGADIDVSTKNIILTGYNTILSRFIYLLYDYTGNAFFSGNKRKITVSGNRQTESIAFRNAEYIYIANENSFFGSQRLESINLTNVLSPYLALLPISQIELTARARNGYIQLDWDIQPWKEFWKGEIQRKSKFDGQYQTLTLINKASGVYYDHSDFDAENVYFRVKAVDKNLIESYGQEQTVKRPFAGSSKIYYASQEIRISLPVTSDIFQIKLMDMMGRTLNKVSTVQRSLRINTSHLPPGIYQVTIERSNYPENKYRFFKN